MQYYVYNDWNGFTGFQHVLFETDGETYYDYILDKTRLKGKVIRAVGLKSKIYKVGTQVCPILEDCRQAFEPNDIIKDIL